MLHTLHDLYLKFIDDYSGNERVPKFLFFAELKPEKCIHAGDPVSHKVCVCMKHENVGLKSHALSRKIGYRDLLGEAVCNVDGSSCMLKNCNNCPGAGRILESL